MKRYFILPIFLICLLVLTGCSQLMRNRAEIDRIFNVRVIAIDKIDAGKILYTITTKSAVSNIQEQQGESKMMEVLVSEGSTVYEASRNMLGYAHRKPHYGHTEFIIFGEDTARDGILPYLDFISRHQEFRYNAKIYIIRGDTANSFVSKMNTGNMFLGQRLSSLEDNSYALSKSESVTLSEALYIFSKDNVATFLPFITVTPIKPGESDSEGNFDLELRNYAVFERDKLQAFLDDELSRGINWITNRIRSGLILAEAPDKKKVSLEIIHNKTSIKPYIEGNELQCTISIKFNTNIAEVLSTEEIFTKEGINYLKQQQENQVKKEVEKVLSYAQEKNMDIFGLVSKFTIKYPMMKNELRENWKEIFPAIKFNVEVDSNINRTYLIKEPAYSK